MKDKKDNTSEKEMGFLDHLEELRWHLVRSAAAVVVLGVIIFIFKDFVFDKIILADVKEFDENKAWEISTKKRIGFTPGKASEK